MIEIRLVCRADWGEEGGEVGGGESGGGGAVERGEGVRQDLVEPPGEGALLGDALARRCEPAGSPVPLAGDVGSDVAEQPLQPLDLEVDIADIDERRRGRGRFCSTAATPAAW